MNIFKVSFLFFAYFMSKVFSKEILNKYSSTQTSKGYIIFDSSQFKIGDEMYFVIKASNDFCSKNLYYDFYDDTDSINVLSEPYYYISSESFSSTSVNGKVTSYKLYFTIKKKENELNGKSGNYLFMKFDCSGSIEFENTKKNESFAVIAIVFIVFGVIILIFIVICIIVCCVRRKIIRRNIPPSGQVYTVNPYYIQGQPMNQVQYANYAYVYPAPTAYNPYSNPNNANIAPNVPVYQNGALPQSAPQTSTNEDIYSPKFEKPK